MRLLLERMSNENAELMSRERTTSRQPHVRLESFDGKTETPYKSVAEDRKQVRPVSLAKPVAEYQWFGTNRFKLRSSGVTTGGKWRHYATTSMCQPREKRMSEELDFWNSRPIIVHSLTVE